MSRAHRAALWSSLLLLAGCTLATAFGPRTTNLPPGGTTLPTRFHRGVFLVYVDLPGFRDQQAMLLDTGTDRTLFDFATARALGLGSLGEESVVTATGASVAASRLQRLPWLRIGTAHFEDIDAVGLDLSALRDHGGMDIVGIAGCDLFRHCLLELDYARRAVRALPRSDAPAHGGHAFAERSPWVTIDVAGTTFRALVDSGFQQTLALPPGSSLPWRRTPRSGGDIAAIDGIAPKSVAQVQGSLRLADLEWQNPFVVLVKGAPKIGAGLLRNCIVRLDASGGRIWIDRRH